MGVLLLQYLNCVIHTYLPVCLQEVDMGFGITWGNTSSGETSVQSCGEDYTGKCMYKQLNVV